MLLPKRLLTSHLTSLLPKCLLTSHLMLKCLLTRAGVCGSGAKRVRSLLETWQQPAGARSVSHLPRLVGLQGPT